MSTANLILKNGRFFTGDARKANATAAAITHGRFSTLGSEQEVMAQKGPATQVIDLEGRTVIPGLIDSHIHTIRGGLNFNLELRWGWGSLARGCTAQAPRAAQRTPPPQWGAGGRRLE
ncbi:amidohydrolase family protein [Stigmatella aurantiaca]|uniref:amidohydrolase family protein n=1 Tax=Stigmatella aurantiaca TaxID=41 RepID=UPI000A3F6A34|nr:amidohydrolase family protein [Stigmatella aurantiaca]